MGDIQLGPVTHLSPADVRALWINNGGNPSKADIAVAIVFSSENPAGNAGLVNDTPATGDYSIGLWQINYLAWNFGPADAFAADPNAQARAAIAMSQNGTNWQAWGPDLGYSGYSQRVTDPLPGSRVANWLGTKSNPLQALLIAGSLLFLAATAANYLVPGSVPMPRSLRI